VRFQLRNQPALAIPFLHQAVSTGTENASTEWKRNQAFNRTDVPGQSVGGFASLYVPDMDGGSAASAEQLAVDCGQCKHSTRVPCQHAERLPGINSPEPHRLVSAAACEMLAGPR
jgi:hypothetical protein